MPVPAGLTVTQGGAATYLEAEEVMRSISQRGVVSIAGVLFLFSLLVILGSLAATVWLCTTKQVRSFDGLFLFLRHIALMTENAGEQERDHQ